MLIPFFFKETTIGANVLMKQILELEVKRIQRLEHRILSESKRNISISTSDIISFKDKYGIRDIEYFPALLRRPDKCWKISERSTYIVFAGPLSFYANYHGLQYFLDKVFSLFVKEYPDIILKITGDYTQKQLSYFSKYQNIEFTGYLQEDALDELISTSLFGIVSIVKGTGIRTKLLELLGLGVPSITTSESAQGIPYDMGEPPFLVAKDSNEFLQSMTKLMRDDNLKLLLSSRSKEFFSKEYEISGNVDSWIKLIDSVNSNG